MWERVQANPQLLLMSAWKLQRLGNGCSLGFVCSRAKAAVISQRACRLSIHFRFSVQSTRYGSYWGLLGDICAYPCRSQPMPGTMEQVPWEPPLSEEEQQEWLNLEPKGWAATSSKYPLALPVLTVMLRRQLCMLILSAVLGWELLP